MRAPLELEILELTNAFRSEHALPPLASHGGLASVASKHAAAVADGLAPFSHRGAPQRFSACGARCVNVAENLARSEGFGREELPRAAVVGWCESEGHRRNLLGPFDVCGIGWAANDAGTVFVTQLLALLDAREEPSLRTKAWRSLRAGTCRAAASTPAVCAVLGLVLAGPVVGTLGGGALGSALSYGCGLRASSLPRAACARAASWLRPATCAGCGAAGELLVGGDGSLLCENCHPAPADGSVWQYID